jgi:hypothetical protein
MLTVAKKNLGIFCLFSFSFCPLSSKRRKGFLSFLFAYFSFSFGLLKIFSFRATKNWNISVGIFNLLSLILPALKGLSHEIDFKNIDKKLHNLA